MVNGLIGRVLVDVVPNFLKYFTSRSFSAEARGRSAISPTNYPAPTPSSASTNT
jgi:hypothetical protein